MIEFYTEDMKKILRLLIDTKALFQRSSRAMKMVGEEAGVGVQPDSQTLLISETEKIPGVLGAGVPGAGGEDAVFALTVSMESRTKVETVCPRGTSQADAPG